MRAAAAGDAAARLRHQGGGLPAVGVAARQLPDRPAPVTAVFAGLLTKVGVYAIIRTETLLFPGGRLADLLMVGGAADHAGRHPRRGRAVRHQADAVVHPGQPHRLHAVRGRRWPRAAGLAGAIFYVVHHITIQTTLFLVAGLIERRGGTTVAGPARRAGRGSRRCSAVLFFVPAMNLAGIPPFSGFLGKLGLLQAGVADGGPLAWHLVAGGAADQPAHPVRRLSGAGTWPSAGAAVGYRRTGHPVPGPWSGPPPPWWCWGWASPSPPARCSRSPPTPPPTCAPRPVRAGRPARRPAATDASSPRPAGRRRGRLIALGLAGRGLGPAPGATSPWPTSSPACWSAGRCCCSSRSRRCSFGGGCGPGVAGAGRHFVTELVSASIQVAAIALRPASARAARSSQCRCRGSAPT